MSYRNPKYTYVSQQPAFDKLQNTINSATKGIADKKEVARKEERARAEKNSLVGQGAEQSFVNSEVNQTYGGVQQGAATKFFEGWSKKTGDLAMNTQGTSPKCEETGDCDVQRRRLAMMKQAPESIKGMITNLASQLTGGEGMNNFDAGQNGNAVLASNIFSGKTEFVEPDYSYRIEESEDGNSYNMVFEYNGDDESKMFTDKDGNVTSSQSYNSLRLQEMATNDSSLLNETPNTSDQTNSAFATSQIISGSTFDKNGKMDQGSGSYNIENFMIDEGGIVEDGSIKENGVQITTYRRIIDKDKVRDHMEKTLNSQADYFTGNKEENIQGNDAEMRTYWNMILSKGNSATYDTKAAQRVFGEGKIVDGKNVDYTEEELKKLWKDSISGDGSYWSTNKVITPEQNKIFRELYKREITTDVTNQLQMDSRNRSTQGPMVLKSNDPGYTPPTTAGFESEKKKPKKPN